MIDGNEKAPGAVTLEAKRRPDRKRCRNYGATPRALQGQVSQAEPCSAPSSADPRSISHSATLIAIAARIVRGGRP